MASELTRRMLLGCAGCGVLSLAAGLAIPTVAHAVHGAADKKTDLTPDQALALLKEGNARFVTDTPLHGIQDRAQRMAIARGQTPIAVLVGCSDSRVPPELLFGRGLGELFIIRNAGNTVDTVALGSIQYAVAELGVPLIVVLGHERCGAVQAAVAVVKDDAAFTGSIGQMIEPILPAVLHAQHQEGDLLDNAVRENVRRIVMGLRTSPETILLEPLQARRLRIVGARYDPGGWHRRLVPGDLKTHGDEAPVARLRGHRSALEHLPLHIMRCPSWPVRRVRRFFAGATRCT